MTNELCQTGIIIIMITCIVASEETAACGCLPASPSENQARAGRGKFSRLCGAASHTQELRHSTTCFSSWSNKARQEGISTAKTPAGPKLMQLTAVISAPDIETTRHASSRFHRH